MRRLSCDLRSFTTPLPSPQKLSSPTRADFFEDLRGSLSDIVGIYRRNESSWKIGQFDAELITKLPSSVKWIAHNGAGYDQIDVNACKARGPSRRFSFTRGLLNSKHVASSGIIVSNTPGAVNDATATTALYLIIAACRQFTFAERNLMDGNWKNGIAASHDPSSRTLGILGLGGIGLRTAELAHAFPMRVVYHSRKPAPNAPDWAAYCPTMEEFLDKTDVLSIHIPLNEQTINIIGEKEIRMMKQGSIIVNTARGKVLDEDALIRALQDGHVRLTLCAFYFIQFLPCYFFVTKLYAAGLDVYPNEPNVNPILMSLPNVTLLPHVGTTSIESQHGMEVRALENLSAFLQGGQGKDIVPEMR
jgi:glyoxylate reductase